ALAAMRAGLIPIVCIGETLQQRESGLEEDTVQRQLLASLPENTGTGEFVLAYEPVWAIGSGRIPTREQVARMHAFIARTVCASMQRESAPPLLYGGSVKPFNAAELMGIAGVDGVLVGGASLNAADFI